MSTEVLTRLRARARATKAFSNEEVKSWAQDYHRFLQAKQLLLTARIARDSIRVVFEQGTGPEVQEAEAQRLLAELPRDRRVVFDAVWEQERQRLQAELEAQQRAEGGRARIVDPNVIDRALHDRLYREAMGLDGDGMGWVPLAPEEDAWFHVDVASLQEAPSADAYLVHPTSAQEQQRAKRVVFAVLGVAVLLLVVWAMWPRGGAVVASAGVPAARVDGTPVPAWPLSTLIVTTTAGTVWTMPISTTTEIAWPSPGDGEPRAFWRAGALHPLRLCVPHRVLADVAALQVSSGGLLPNRRYQGHERSTEAADLVLESCAGGKLPAWRGSLRDVVPLPVLDVGQSVNLPDETVLTVAAIMLDGPGTDPRLPAQQARLTVHVQTSAPLDWPRYAPSLLLPTGQIVPVAETEATGDGAALRYVVPLPAQPLAVRWVVLPPGGGPSVQWQAVLQVPPPRMEALRAALVLVDVQVTPSAAGQAMLVVVLRNTAPQPLVLTRDDIVLTQGDQRMPMPDSAALQQPLQGGQTITLELPLPQTEVTTPIMLTIGPHRVRLERR